MQRVEEALDADAGARVMMQLPTGGGKTVIAGKLLGRRLIDRRKAVWLTHRMELADQTRDMLTDARVSAMPGDRWPRGKIAPAMHNGVVILMAQKVARRIRKSNVWSDYDAADLMVIDEAHHATAKGWERAMKQWPGQVMGMTATPWRLSEKEGFDHLFGSLYCGPQVADLQANEWLCNAKVLMPPPERRIRGGRAVWGGDYNESGIEQANSDRPDVMTAMALKFWQEHAQDRQTIVYAVSQGHARNLVKVFQDAGTRAEVILSDTPQDERAEAIGGFKEGTVKVLVNVAVATEGFDLPDASCIVITRPTLSLALFLQMVGRGLRPKENGGNCLILDLADNTPKHGLPEAHREWSLEPRGTQPSGEAPVVRCDECSGVSPAASHDCKHCGEPLGEDCSRCGKWRAWERWEYKEYCNDSHDLVCDYCHEDAHIQAGIAITPPLDELPNDDGKDNGMQPTINGEVDEDLAERLVPLIEDLLERERQSAMDDQDSRRDELSRSIQRYEVMERNEGIREAEFVKYLDELPEGERPQNRLQEGRRVAQWEKDNEEELQRQRNELARLESHPLDKLQIYNSARHKLMSLLSSEAQEAGLLPGDGLDVGPDGPVASDAEWILLSSSNSAKVTGSKPRMMRTPEGKEIQAERSSWKYLFIQVAEWLIQNNRLSTRSVATYQGSNLSSFISDSPVSKGGNPWREPHILSNGLYLRTYASAATICDNIGQLGEVAEPRSQFHVKVL